MPKYKAIDRINKKQGCWCEGCAGNISDKKCLEISEYVSERKIKSCVGSDGVIYVEVKNDI